MVGHESTLHGPFTILILQYIEKEGTKLSNRIHAADFSLRVAQVAIR